MRKLFFLLLMQILGLLVMAQNTSDEQAIRSLIDKERAGDATVIKRTDNSVFASGRFVRPIIGKPDEEQVKEDADAVANRKNQKITSKTNRLEVAKSGDLAYEFGEYKLEFDTLSNEHVVIDGTYVRTWKKIDGQWMVDLHYVRPNRK
ncbi:nuclear transport factor 2 family protein [Flavisolibacter sp. BT320]|nr:nuclear transport factor 2 family protein [Flavisolibacter longurius]